MIFEVITVLLFSALLSGKSAEGEAELLMLLRSLRVNALSIVNVILLASFPYNFWAKK